MKIVCGECGGNGIAEHIESWPRPCDACHGDGELKVPFAWGLYFRVSDWLTAKRRAA